jgi:hypothetical protein
MKSRKLDDVVFGFEKSGVLNHTVGELIQLKKEIQRLKEISPNCFNMEKLREECFRKIDHLQLNQYQRKALTSIIDQLVRFIPCFYEVTERYIEALIGLNKLKEKFLLLETGFHTLYGCLTGDFKDITTNPALFKIFIELVREIDDFDLEEVIQ